MKSAKKRCSAYSEAKITRTESNKRTTLLQGIFTNDLLALYKVQRVKFSIHLERCEVVSNYGILNGSEANLAVKISKLVLYNSLFNLVFIYLLEDHHFHPPDFLYF